VQKRLSTPIFSIKWKGWILIPESGVYKFATTSDDGSFLRINKKLVVDNGGHHGLEKVSGEIFLEKGSSPFEVLYFNSGGPGAIKTFWTPPNRSEERIPGEYLFVKRPTLIDFRLRKGIMRSVSRFRTPGLILGIVLILLLPLLVSFKVVTPKFQTFLRSASKRLIFSGIILIFIIGILEVFSAAFFIKFQEQFTFFDAQQYLVTEERQEKKRAIIESSGEQYLALGWDTNFSTPYGERPRKTLYNKPFISTFGDSFMYCAEVEDDQTWQTHLADFLKMDVYNFGVSGYGTDQAYLKFLSVYPEIRTPVVVLGVTTENINRIVNVYRPFYFPGTAGRSTKPRFILKNNKLDLLENPIRNKEEIKKLGDIQFIQQIGKFDWWYNRDNHPILQFPYSKILFNKRMWLEAFYGKGNRKIDDMNPRPWENLWGSEEARNLMFRILDAFVDYVEEHNAIPIIMVLPLQAQVRLKFNKQRHEEKVVKLLQYCERQKYLYFEGITPLAKSVTTEEQIRDLYAGHVSPKGNRILAEAMFQYLQKALPDLISHYQKMEDFQVTALE
jgi:hypothetical protein